MSAYPEYTLCDGDWIKEIPSGWDIVRGKYLFEIKKRIVGELGHDVLSITQKGMKVKDTESGDGQLSMDYSKYQTVETGDFAMNHMDLLTGYVDISKYNGVTSPDYRVFTSKETACSPRYFLYVFQMGYTNKIFFKYGQGASHLGRWRLPTEEFNNFWFPCPPKKDREKIANFLDHETAKIDTLIDKQQQLIKLLKEKRQAVISHAVTKGLNPNAPMRDSGVEWLGEVPEHWVATRAKFISNIFVPQRNKPDLNDLTGIAWATMEDMKSRYINSTKQFVSVDSSKAAGSKTLKAGSVIASCVGNFGVTAINRIDVIINQQLQAFVPTGIKSEYLREIVSISTVYFDLIGTAATLVYVNQQGFENLPVLVPTEREQNDICIFVEKECNKFDKLVKLSETTTHLLKERRTALISAAVTGKIDVRNWQTPTTNSNKDVAA